MRAVAFENQKVQIINKVLFVDGVQITESYAHHDDPIINRSTITLTSDQYQKYWEEGKLGTVGGILRDNFGPVVVPKDQFFVLGDNRDFSFDSRFWGPVPVNNVTGRASYIFSPINRQRWF
jgi:signal peptidase I